MKTKTSFDQLISTDVPVLIDFYADWCGPCKMMPPILKEVKNQYGDAVKVVKINVDKNNALAQRFQVRSIPTLMIFKNGELQWQQAGVPSTGDLKRVVQQFV